MPVPSPKRIGKYDVIDIIGHGGMGVVYRAFDRQLNREVAIKTITQGFAGDQEMLTRFYREAAKTAALKHPNIVVVHDLGEEGGCPYIVMEYLPGEGLDEIIRSQPGPPLAFKLRIIEQVCDALGYAHRQDVIHRDVKPANVIVQPEGDAKLLDFGIACREEVEEHLTRTGSLIGTIQYMAPERLENRPFDGRSDVFSVGVMLYELLTGHLPFDGNVYGIVQKLLSEQHQSLRAYIENYPSDLDSIIDRALAKHPNERYSTAEEMAADLASVAAAVRNQQVFGLFSQAKDLADRNELAAAHGVLRQLLKIDNHHSGARELLASVQRRSSRPPRVEPIWQLRWQEEESPRAPQVQEPEARKHLDEVVERGHLLLATSPREARDLVAQELSKFPGNERLLSLKARIEAQLSQPARDKDSNSYLVRARRALDSRQYSLAVEILETCQSEGIFSQEITGLLGLARRERERQISRGQLLRDKADAVVEHMRKLAAEGQYEEALSYGQSQPADLLRYPSIEEMLNSLRRAREREAIAIRSIGAAYAALGRSEVKSAWTELDTERTSPCSSFLEQMLKVFEERCRSVADQKIDAAIQQAETVLNADATQAVTILTAIELVAPYASERARRSWELAQRKTAQASGFRSFGT